jgi:dihydrolipoamide dehydrogenase
MIVGDIALMAELVVVGAGPAGYVAAIRAAQLGKQVLLIDPEPPGGVCLREGCIPSKALLSAVERAHQVPHLATLGIHVGELTIDLAAMQAWKDGIVERLSGGVRQLLESRHVEHIVGKARFVGERELRVHGAQEVRRLSFERCIVAVGSEPLALDGLPFDGGRVLSPAQALQLRAVPASVAVIGADYIAVEQATLFAKLGAAVRLVVPRDRRVLYEFDPIAGRLVTTQLKRLGVKVEADTSDLVAAAGDAERVIVALGSTPRTPELNLPAARVRVDERGFIVVGKDLRSSNGAIFAAGDVTGGPQLATAAIKHGKVAAEALAGLPSQYAPQTVPRVAWTDPEVAMVGYTAAEAEAQGYSVLSGRFPLAANGRALTLDAPEGMVLTVAERESGVILGVTVVGQRAGELIGEAALAIEMGATLTDLAETLHPHPGLSETLQEAAEAALGVTVHLVRP